MDHRFIPSHGIGEVFINGNYWEMFNSSFHNLKKEIPFFKLLLELGSLNMRVIIQGFDQEIDIYRKTLITDFRRKTTFLIESFTKIEDLCDGLYSTGHIETGGQCMEIFRKSVNNKLPNFFAEDYTVCEEMKEALEKLKKELGDFVYYFDDLVTTFFFFSQIITENEKFLENFDRMK